MQVIPIRLLRIAPSTTGARSGSTTRPLPKSAKRVDESRWRPKKQKEKKKARKEEAQSGGAGKKKAPPRKAASNHVGEAAGDTLLVSGPTFATVERRCGNRSCHTPGPEAKRRVCVGTLQKL